MSNNLKEDTVAFEPVVLVHGGAWDLPECLVSPNSIGIQNAARAGLRVLECEDGSGTAMDAVVAAVCVLEDDPSFDAGTGSFFTSEGNIEMDAIVMEGRNLNTGAVACVQNIRNPIKLARLVMEKTNHILLVGDGANTFAQDVGMEEVATSALACEFARNRLDDMLNSSGDHDTVGAVALDRYGNVACAASTGGLTGKMPGRVGDSPLVGCGAYCDNTIGAVCCTGHGEPIAKVTLARRTMYNMENGDSAQAAAECGLSYMKCRVAGTGGTIAVNHTGDIGIGFTTKSMPWAWARSGTLHYGVKAGDDTAINI